MEPISYEIQPTIGMGNLKFGDPADVIMAVLGKPSEIEKDEDAFFNSYIWSYPEKNLTLFLQEAPVPFLVNIETSEPSATLFGRRIFELSEEELISFMEQNGFHHPDTENEEWGERRVSYDDFMIDFYFEDGKLTSVNWSMMLEDED